MESQLPKSLRKIPTSWRKWLPKITDCSKTWLKSKKKCSYMRQWKAKSSTQRTILAQIRWRVKLTPKISSLMMAPKHELMMNSPEWTNNTSPSCYWYFNFYHPKLFIFFEFLSFYSNLLQLYWFIFFKILIIKLWLN